MTVIINFILFQLGWFACVLGAANAKPWVGTIAVGLILVFHLYRSSRFERELVLLMIAVLVGALWESLLVWMGLVNYSSGMWSQNLAPHWIIALWALFATTLNVSLDWLKSRLLLASISAAVAGPLAYYAGQRLGALTFPDTGVAMAFLACGWAVFVPLLLWLAQRLDGYAHLPSRRGAQT